MTEIVRTDPVTCQPKTTDRYGRTVATCATATVPDVGAEMIRRGWAIDYRAYDRGHAYLAIEDEARAAKRGVWSGRFTPPWVFRRK